MASKSIVIKGGHILTGGPQGELPIGDLLIVGNEIAAIAPTLDPAETAGAEVIDGTGKIVMPGLVDSHRHVWQGLAGGLAGGVTLNGYFSLLAGLAGVYRPEDVYFGTAWGALQAINAGITTVVDWSHIVTTPAHADENVQALRDSGIRAVFLYGPPVGLGVEKWLVESTEPHPADVRRMRSELADDQARVTMGLALRGPEFSTAQVTADDIRLGRELGLPMSMHSGIPGYTEHYRTLATIDESVGLGPDLHHVHGTGFSDEDLKQIAATGGFLTACPTVDIQMGIGSNPIIGRADDAGLSLGLGVDTVAGAGSDLFSEMRTALTVERAREYAGSLSAGTLPEMVRVLHQDVLRHARNAPWHLADRVGSLQPGRYADIVLIDAQRPHLVPLNDPVTTIVLNAGPSDVDTVIVDGIILKRGGRFTGPAARVCQEVIAAL